MMLITFLPELETATYITASSPTLSLLEFDEGRISAQDSKTSRSK